MPQISKIKLNGELYDIKVDGKYAVTGVKGNNEPNYRHGNVNITKENIGLGNVENYKAVSTQANQGLSNIEKENAKNNIGCDSTPTNGSSNLITSGGVYSYIDLMITKALNTSY